ncbi:MAG: ribosome maturation factor RimM [Desulfobacterales bacterium]|nr:ribosome maturation factor RimM [Desulfobacterales bacterium]
MKDAEKNNLLLIGKIVGVHGLNGTVKVCSYAESLSDFKPGGLILARDSEGRDKTYVIQRVKPHVRTILLSFKGVDDRDMSEALIGCDLFIEKAKCSEPEDGSYYWFDIIGLSVYTIDGKFIGSVESIIPTGSNDVYVVKNDDDEILIPGLESVVKEIDLKQKIMRVDLPEGL